MAEILEWDSFIKCVADFLGMEVVEINKDTHVYNDLGIDSLGLFSLGMQLIKVFGIKLPMSAVSTITTIGSLYDEMNKTASK
jgi:acyl carrier protein